MRVAVIGTGAMAEAIISGLLQRGILTPADLIGSHPRSERAAELQARHGIEVVRDNAAAVRGAAVVLLAVKPQVLLRVLGELAGNLSPEALLVSIVAGASTEALARASKHKAVVRVMPNTPAQIGAGVSVWFATGAVTAPGRDTVRCLLSALGTEVEVDEEAQVAMATAVSGTGPTYAFLFLESLVEAAVHLGFPRHLARRLVLETARGSVEFAIQSGDHPAQLRDMVTSPGGTSAEAQAALERGRFRTVLADAVWAAYRRTLQLQSSIEAVAEASVEPGQD